MTVSKDAQGKLSRRGFVGSSAALVLAAGAQEAHAAPSPASAQAGSTYFSTAFVEYYGSHPTASNGDLWPSCWADDDAVYTANGDGKGFDLQGEFADAVVNRIDEIPETGITGQRLAAGGALGPVWGDPAQYSRKPTGMVCVEGVLYLALQDLKLGENKFDTAPSASISRSDDHGKTWRPTSRAMFQNSRFTTVFFLDFGKDHRLARIALGPRDGDYVYAYGLDWNWRDSYSNVVRDPTRVYLGRVPPDAVQDRDQWEFFAGLDRFKPLWSKDIVDKAPVLDDPRRTYQTFRGEGSFNLSVISQGGVVYNAPLQRYLYTSRSTYTFEFYESPTPWGPWKLFLQHDAGGYPHYGLPDGQPNPGPKNVGYAPTIPSKFISADGRHLWLQSNWFSGKGAGHDNYQFNLRKLQLEVAHSRPPERQPSNVNLARLDGVTPIEKSAHYGHWEYYNDGDLTKSEDSFDRSNKELDWWGYQWPWSAIFGRVVYTTGSIFPTGGWFTAFDGGLRVQIRRNFRWVDVDDLRITPDYPYDANAGPTKTYVLRFRPTIGDGIRIIGPPGGTEYFTSIAELEVYSGG